MIGGAALCALWIAPSWPCPCMLLRPPSKGGRRLPPKDPLPSDSTSGVHARTQLLGLQREVLRYSRGPYDDVQLTATLYTPPGYDAARDGPLPCILWAYPREYKSKVQHWAPYCAALPCWSHSAKPSQSLPCAIGHLDVPVGRYLIREGVSVRPSHAMCMPATPPCICICVHACVCPGRVAAGGCGADAAQPLSVQLHRRPQPYAVAGARVRHSTTQPVQCSGCAPPAKARARAGHACIHPRQATLCCTCCAVLCCAKVCCAGRSHTAHRGGGRGGA